MAGQQRNVLAPLAQRRHADRHDAEAIEQILAEPPGGDLAPTDRGSTRRRRGHRPRPGARRRPARRSAPAAPARSCPGSRAACRPTSSSNKRAAMRLLERADLARPVAAGLGAEQLDLEPVGPHRRAIEDDERPVGAARARVQQPRRPLPCRPRRAPVIRTRLPVGATRSICWRSWFMAGEAPTSSSVAAGAQPQFLVLAAQPRGLDARARRSAAADPT